MNTKPSAQVIASQVDDPARAIILSVLESGRALTTREIARATGATVETVNDDLSVLQRAGIVAPRRQGPHEYFQLADDAVAQQAPGVVGPAARQEPATVVTGPKDPALRQARVCYGHLAGPRAVRLFDAFIEKGVIARDHDALRLTNDGETFVREFGIDVAALKGARQPACKPCLDWTERRSHLAGPLGTALMKRITTLGWATRDRRSRLVTFSRSGEAAFDALFTA